MKFTRLSVSILCAALLSGVSVLSLPAATNETSAPTSQDDIKIDVQVDELGMMRVLLVFDAKSLASAKVVEQRLSDSDFRVFVDDTAVDGLMSAEAMKTLGKKEQADIVFYAQSSSRLKNKLDDFTLYEGEATVQVYSPVTGEMMATETTRANGVRNSDEMESERSAREKAIDTATKDVIVKMLVKAQKILVHEATITGVYNDNQLLEIMDYMGKMQGVYGVRQVLFDRAAHVGVIDIIGNPRSETYWRAYIEKMPKAKVVVKVTTNSGLRKKYPSWFDN